MGKDYNGYHTSSLALTGGVFSLVLWGWWVYGIFTTFSNGEVPVIGWTTDHNIIMGILWTIMLGRLFIGQGIAGDSGFTPGLPRTLHNIFFTVSIWKRGYVYLPFFVLNLFVQLYSWIIIITVWFPQPLPPPFGKFSGGFSTGIVGITIIFPICLVGNITACRLMRSFTLDTLEEPWEVTE